MFCLFAQVEIRNTKRFAQALSFSVVRCLLSVVCRSKSRFQKLEKRQSVRKLG